jgi:hypothetical protein
MGDLLTTHQPISTCTTCFREEAFWFESLQFDFEGIPAIQIFPCTLGILSLWYLEGLEVDLSSRSRSISGILGNNGTRRLCVGRNCRKV